MAHGYRGWRITSKSGVDLHPQFGFCGRWEVGRVQGPRKPPPLSHENEDPNSTRTRKPAIGIRDRFRWFKTGSRDRNNERDADRDSDDNSDGSADDHGVIGPGTGFRDENRHRQAESEEQEEEPVPVLLEGRYRMVGVSWSNEG